MIDRKPIPEEEKLFYLEKYLSGEAKGICEGLFLVGTGTAYQQARKLLEERYGAPHIVADAFRDKLDSWPKIQPKDGASLQKLADFLNHCLAVAKTMSALSILDDERENRKLLHKLPDWIVSRWARIVVDHRRQGSYPSFTTFVEFVNEEAKVATERINASDSSVSVAPKRKRTVTVFNNKKADQQKGKDVKEVPSKVKSVTQPQTSCVMCKKNHKLEVCLSYLNLPLKDREQVVKDNKICFKCLTPGHFSKTCRKKKPCAVCNKLHPTSLHRYTTSVDSSSSGGDNSGTTFCSDTLTDGKCSMILPVKVSHTDRPEQEVQVYALLDSQSDTCFILDHVADHLGLAGTPVDLTLSTMCSKKKPVPSTVFTGLRVRGIGSVCSINLPPTFSREIMPANRDHIPTPEKLKGWPHLQGSEKEFKPLSDSPI